MLKSLLILPYIMYKHMMASTRHLPLDYLEVAPTQVFQFVTH